MNHEIDPGLARLSFDTTQPRDYVPTIDPNRLRSLSLLEVFNLCGTDKGEVGNGHRYDLGYQKIFDQLPENASIAEIGVACGASLRAFAYYLPGSLIHGYDIRPECQHLCKDVPNIEIFIHDALTHGLLHTYDLIIDDASHICEDIIQSFRANWSKLRPGGFYVIEDLACVGSPEYTSQHNQQFGRATINSRALFADFTDFLLKAIDSRKCIESMIYLPEMLILKKRD